MKPTVWHPFTQHGLGEDVIEIVRTEGALLRARDGRTILDGISSWWVTTHGHSHPKIVEAIAHAAQSLDQVVFAGFTHEHAEALARELLDLVALPLRHVFYTDSGSTSVEVALKMALGYWRNRSEPRHRILVMEHSYHGDTIGAMSVGARGVFNQAYAPLLFDVGRIPFPKAGQAQATLDELERLCRAPDAPAALIVEPLILGAGGMLMYGAATLAEMRAVCARHRVLFIADEIMTGWGRTGTLLACEQAGVAPDILCLSKGLTAGSLPLAATLASEAIFDAHWSKDPAKLFFHSSSYTANPIACAAARANIAIWREEPVLDRIALLAERQAARLSQVPGVRARRQLGTVTAFEVGGDAADYLAAVGSRLRAFFLGRDVLLRPLGNTIYVMPPYCTTNEQLDTIYAAIGDAVQRLGSTS